MISRHPGTDGARDRLDARVLLAITGARQAASPTARAQARLPAPRPRTGAAFAAPVAERFARSPG